MAHISPIAPKLHGYHQTYATFHDTSMEHEVIDSDTNMPMTLPFSNLQVFMSRDCLSQAAATTTKWIHYFIFDNDSHFHYLYGDHNPFMQLHMNLLIETHQSHKNNSKGDIL